MLSLYSSSTPETLCFRVQAPAIKTLPFASPVHRPHPSIFLSVPPCHSLASQYIDSHSLWEPPSLTVFDLFPYEQVPCLFFAYGGWALGGFNKLFSDRLFIPNCFIAAVFPLDRGERACNSSCMHAVHFVFKVRFVGLQH